jgi:ribosomal protein S18 acetylase RimI-like enzyme
MSARPANGAVSGPVDLTGDARDRAVPVLRDGFVGIYRWHAKRTLRQVPIVRALERNGAVIAVSLLDLLVPEVGYVYYLAVASSDRQQGLASRLLDDALAIYRARGVEVVYAAARTDNAPSLRLFTHRGFRPVERKETSWKEGGLGAWGLRSRMWVVAGEVLLGVRLKARGAPVGLDSVSGSP